MTILFGDFETFYSENYSLKQKSMTTQKYIMDPRFKAHGIGLARMNEPGIWVPGRLIGPAVKKLVPGSTFVCHNAAFDVSILAWRYGVVPKRVIDTESLSRALIGGSSPRHGLDAIAKLLLGYGKTFGLEVSKGKWDLTPEEEATLARYCVHDKASDINLTRAIFKRLIPHLPKFEWDVINWCAKAFACPQLVLRTDVLAKYHEEVKQSKVDVLKAARLDSRNDLMSNDKYADLLRGLGVEPPTKISKNTFKEGYAFAKTDEDHKALLDHEDYRVQALVAARMEVKSTIEETRSLKYYEASLLGPWPVHYKFSGAEQTHRFSGSDGAGGNPQNLKRGGVLREAIEAPDGYVLLVGDLSQIEARIVMGLAGETTALDVFRAYDADPKNNVDPYCWFGGTHLYKRVITKADKNERQISKSGFLGCGYGAGEGGLYVYAKGLGVNITREQAGEAVKAYRAAFPGVVRLWRIADRAIAKAHSGEEYVWPAMKPLFTTCREPVLGVPAIKMPGGLHIKFPNLRRAREDNVDEKTKEKLSRFEGHITGQWVFDSGRGTYLLWGGTTIENVVQSLARNVVLEMLLKIDKIMPAVMVTHDEIICLVKQEKAEVGAKIMRKIMSTPPEWWADLPMGCGVGYDKSYGRVEK